MDNLIGQSLGHYRIDALLGEGGMGAVYKATDVTLQRAVALKFLHPQFVRDPQFQKRFLNEARTAAQLDHSNIVRVLDFGSSESMLYIVMEFLPGDNLRKLLLALAAKHQTIALAETANLVRQILLTLDYIHRHGILHRDMKPENIMLKPEPGDGLPYRPIITDLGLARLISNNHLTEQGTSMGTLAYMSPEQAQGLDTDARTDVYAVGVLLYELAVGQLPFQVRSITEAIRYHTQQVPRPPRSLRPEIPEPLERVILRALEKDPANRFQTAAAMAEAIKSIPVEPISTATLISTDGVTIVAPGSLLTVHAASTANARGNSILGDFPLPEPVMRQDRIGILAPGSAVRYMLMKPQGLTIGRAPGMDVVLEDDQVSRRHAQIHFDGTDYFVTDLGSTNGTFLANFKLLPQAPQKWTPDKPLQIGKHYFRLERASGEGAVALSDIGGTRVPSGSGLGHVGIVLENHDFTVEPGSSVVLPLTVINQSEIVDHYTLEVLGVPVAWFGGGIPSVQLLPGERRPVPIRIQPPRAATSQAGLHRLRIRAVSQDSPDQSAETKANLTVIPFHQLSSSITPEKVSAGKPSQVNIRNLGNAQEKVTLAWRDPANALTFRPADTQITVNAGAELGVPFTAAPHGKRLLGGEVQYPYLVQVTPVAGEASSPRGTVVSRGVIPLWLPPFVFVLLLLMCGLLYAALVRQPNIQFVTLDPAQPQPNQDVHLSWGINNCSSVSLWDGGKLLMADLPCQLSTPLTMQFETKPNLYLTASNLFAPLVGVATRVPEIALITPTPRPTPTSTPTLEPKAPVIEQWVVEPQEIVEGQGVKIRWKVSNADTVVIQPFGNVDLEGEITDKPRQPRTYTLLVSNKDKTVQRAQEVYVTVPTPTLNFGATDAFIASGRATETAAAQQTAAAQETVAQITIVANNNAAQATAQARAIQATLAAIQAKADSAQAQQTAAVANNWNGTWKRVGWDGGGWSHVRIALTGNMISANFYELCKTQVCESEDSSGTFDGNSAKLKHDAGFFVRTYTLRMNGSSLHVTEFTQNDTGDFVEESDFTKCDSC